MLSRSFHSVGPERPCGIVGSGRLARHLSFYFGESGVPVRAWSRREGGSLAEALGDAPVVFILITDDAIDRFVRSRPELEGRLVIHCSGSLVTPVAHGMHPLMSFGPDLYGLAVYWAIPFVSDRDGPRFSDVFPSLPNPSYSLDPAKKPLYHALSDLAGNLTPLLWERLFLTFERELGLPREVATMYLRRVVDVCEGPTPFPRTGPIARGDAATVKRNLAALGSDSIRAVYEGFARAVSPGLLEGDGGAPPPPAAPRPAPEGD